MRLEQLQQFIAGVFLPTDLQLRALANRMSVPLSSSVPLSPE
jgi:hypothetical protein